MSSQTCDIVILGGGLAGGLAALAFARARPDMSLCLVEQGETLGGRHLWSFFGSDVGKAGRELLAPLVEAAWPGYTVRFPQYDRQLETSYYAMTSARLDAALRAALPADAILCNRRALACSETAVTLSDGTRLEAGAVIDARGVRLAGHLTGGWQKFVGQRLKLKAPHGLERPVIMDATVEQIDGYRFLYCLPFAPDEVFIEDTYYADGTHLDISAIHARIEAYALARGWRVEAVLDEETGVLPVVAGGDFDGLWRATGGQIARAGSRAGLFHAVTSYSVPDAVRFALALARQDDLSGQALAVFSEEWARRHWQRGRFDRALSSMLFAAAEPRDRYRVLQRFYRLDQRLIERFYAGRSTALDKMRILAGRPPVAVGRAIGVLTGLGAKPQALHHSSQSPSGVRK